LSFKSRLSKVYKENCSKRINYFKFFEKGEIKMSDIINRRASESLGKEVTVFLQNGFRFKGKLTNADESYLEILDYISNGYKIIKIDEIKEMEVGE